MTHVKFCGLSTPEEVQLAADLDASFVGFVVQAPRSHRDLPLDDVAELVKGTPPEVETVLVTPETDRDQVHHAVSATDPEIVQLTGPVEDELAQTVARKHGVRVWRAYNPGLDPATELERLEQQAATCDALVLDAVDASGYGGHGDTLNWEHVRTLVQELAGFPVVLAGGLTAENVANAIDWVRPWCVDVSSGIETEANKDPERMRAFAQAVDEVAL